MQIANKFLNSIKELFREWYGNLSVEELVYNRRLAEIILSIEAKLSLITE